MKTKVLYLGASTSGGVSIYISNLIKNIENISFYIPNENTKSYLKMKNLYQNTVIFDFNQNYTLKTLFSKAKELDVFIKKNGIDIIHAHVLRFGLLGAIYKKYFNNNIKLIYTGHGSRYLQKNKKHEKWLFKKIELFINSISDKVVFIRELEYKESIENKLLPIKKAVIIKTQIKLDIKENNTFSIRKKYHISTKNIVAMVGSVYEIKNPFLFCHIAEEVLKKRKDTTFLWIGDGPMLPEMNEYIKSKKLNNIKFIGSIDYQDIKDAWNAIDVLLLTSKIEIFPLILLEAYQNKSLVLSTNYLGVAEVIKNGFTGYIYNMNDVKEASDLLNNIFSYENITQLITNNAKSYYHDNFENITEMSSKHTQIYKEIL